MFIFVFVTGTGFGISQSSRLSSSVSAMRVLNTGSDVEEAVADALVRITHLSCVGYRLFKCLVPVHYHAEEPVIYCFISFLEKKKRKETELVELQVLEFSFPTEVLAFEKHAFFNGRQETVLDCSTVLKWPKEPLEQVELTNSFSQKPEQLQDRL